MADLVDFELPPYSTGSSSGESDTKQQDSPVKRKSSSSSEMAQQQQHQASTSTKDLYGRQSNDAITPNLKNLLVSSYSKAAPLFHWKKPIETGIIFALGIQLIIALTFFSIISVVAYTALALILSSGLIRLYKTLMKTLNKSTETPVDHIWDKLLAVNVSISPERMHNLVDASLSNVNASLAHFKQVLLVEDKIGTVKFGLFLYSLTYIGAWFNGMTLITVCYLALFTVPIFYEKNKTKIDEYLNLATSQISRALSMFTSKVSSVAFGSSPVPSTSGSSTKKQN